MSKWRESSNVLIRVHLSRYDDPSKTFVYEGPVEGLLSDDDGGQSGYDSVQSAAAQNPDGSGGDWEAWGIDRVEFRDI